MNSTTCWYCNREIVYDGEKYRDIECKYCGAEISIYDPLKYKPMEGETKKEEEDAV